MLQIELDPLRLCFRLGRVLPGGPQSRGGGHQRFPRVRRPDRQLLGQSHLTLNIFRFVRLQPLHRALLRPVCRRRELPVEVGPQRHFGAQARGGSGRGRPLLLPHRLLESLQRHFV